MPRASAESHPEPGRERRIALLVPKQGWSEDEFEDYWLHRHGELVATTPAYGRYRADYVQDHILRPELGAEPFPYAGVASVRLPGGGAPDFSSTAMFRERILPDEEHFLDREVCVALRVLERRIRRGPGEVKCLAFGAFAQESGEPSPRFDAADGLPASAPRPTDRLIGEVLAPPTDLGGAILQPGPRIDWVEETRFRREQDAIEHFSARRSGGAAPPLWAFISREHVLFAGEAPTSGDDVDRHRRRALRLPRRLG